ncbi:MAG: PilZ domain-containing protein [Terriglobia bacterium]
MERKDRRRSPRVSLSIPLRVKWSCAEGTIKEEQTRTEVLNGAGARIHLMIAVDRGTEMEIVNLENQESARARVVWASEHSPQEGQRVGIEFLTPRAAFWGSQYSP